MNKIFKTVFNEKTNSWVAVSEISKAHKVSTSSYKNLSPFSLSSNKIKILSILIANLSTVNYAFSETASEICKFNSNVFECKTPNSDKDDNNNDILVKDATFLRIKTNAHFVDTPRNTAFGGVEIASTGEGEGLGSNAVAIYGSAIGDNSTAIGGIARGYRGLAVGGEISKNSRSSIAIGNGSGIPGYIGAYVDGNYSIAIGNESKVYSNRSVALGNSTIIGNKKFDRTAESAVAIGSYAKVYSNKSIAIGSESSVGKYLVDSSYKPDGLGGVAIGYQAHAATNGSVAIGEYSSSYREAGEIGYSPLNKNDESIVWKSNRGAVSFGKMYEDDSGTLTQIETRQITGVAAGSADTDAVNVAQLKEVVLAKGGLRVGAYDKNKKEITPSNNVITTLNLVAGDNVDLSYDSTNNNLTISATGTGNGGGLSSFTVSGGDDKSLTVNSTNNYNSFKIQGGNDNINTTISGQNVSVNLNSTLTGLDSITSTSATVGGVSITGGKITNLSAGENDSDAVNYGQIKDFAKTVKVNEKTFDAENGVIDLGTISGGDAIVFENGTNTTYDNSGDKVKFNLNTDLAGLNSITSTSATVGGVGISGGKITNLSAGENDTDAVNYGQIKDFAKTVKVNEKTFDAENGVIDLGTISGGDAIVFENGTNTTYDNSGDKVKFNLNTDLTGLNSITSTSATVGGVGISGGKITNLSAGENDTDAVNYGQIKDFAKTVKVNEKTFDAENGVIDLGTISGGDAIVFENGTNTTYDNSGDKVKFNLNTDLTGLNSITSTSATVGGVSITGGKITNLSAGENDTDAVNYGQIKDFAKTVKVNEQTFDAENGVIDLGTISGGDAVVFENGTNTTYDNSGDKVKFNLNTDLTGLNSITSTSATVGGVSITGGKITNLSAGENDTDAVNYGQIKNFISGVQMQIGGQNKGELTKNVNLIAGDNINLDWADNGVKISATATGNGGTTLTNAQIQEALNSYATAQNPSFTTFNDLVANQVSEEVKDVAIQDASGKEFKLLNASANPPKVLATGGITATVDDTENTLNFTLDDSVATDSNLDTKIADAVKKDTAKNAVLGVVSDAKYQTEEEIKKWADETYASNSDFTELDNKVQTVQGEVKTLQDNVGDVKIQELAQKVETFKASNYEDITIKGNSGEYALGSGKTAEFLGDGKNITTEAKGENGSGSVVIKLSEDISVNSVSANSISVGNTVINNSGISSDRISVGGTVIDSNGINAGGNRIQGVAAGVAPDDAVNVEQLQSVANSLTEYVSGSEARLAHYIDRVERRANAAAAAAMASAGLQTSALPGGSSMSLSAVTFGGEQGYAMGYSKLSQSGKWGFRAFGNGNSRGKYGVGASIGFHWQ